MASDTKESPASSTAKRSVFFGTRDAMERLSVIQGTMKKVGELLHPNRITALRLPIGASALILSRINAIAAGITYGIATFLDWVDGASARASGKQTEAGARLDPLVDKLVNDTALLVAMVLYWSDSAFALAAGANIAVDILSQRQRGPLLDQCKEGVQAVRHPEACPTDNDKPVQTIRANAWGKIKFLLQSGAIGALLVAGERDAVRTTATVALMGSALAGGWGTLQRLGASAIHRLRGKETMSP